MTVKEFKHDYFSFKGRLNRKPFLMRLMMLGAISIFFVLIVINAEPHLKEDPAHFATNVRKSLVFWVYYIPLIIASISLGVRRLHDLNLSGWWMLLGSGALLSTVNTGNTAIDLAAAILFYIAQLFNLFLIFFRGTKWPNRFGEDPVPQPVKEKKKTKEERRAEAKARKEAAEAEKRADEELEREIAEVHPDWDEYDRYDAMQEAKAKREAEKAAAEVKDGTENKESK
ncbi:putative uncharacterized protein [Phascolarctobacterium sp. CAG:266]|nr:putative uncharacterized protein [Phascolarctobacterium sp. CAG:266]